MTSGRQADLLMSFLAGLGVGAVLGRRFGFPGGDAEDEVFPSRPVAAGLTAASVRRVHTLLGEIRGLVAARKGGKGADRAIDAALEAGLPPPLQGGAESQEAAGASAAESAAGPAARESGAHQPSGAQDAGGPGPRTPPRETWRIPDQIGYGRRFPRGVQAGAMGGAALVACAAAAASNWGSRKGGRMRAAWPAIPGLLAAALLWRRDGDRSAGRALGDRIHRLQGRMSARRGRPAVP